MTDQQVIDDRYTLIERIGSGGMADVYLAEDRQLDRNVAIKLLHRRFAEDPEFVERFRREASAAAGLQHPNVVAVYDRGKVDDTYYIAMEYLEGRSLKQLIADEAPLEPQRAIDLIVQVLQAARFAHKRGIIHRDLKPHNVIVDSEDVAKVTDFGIARAGASDMTQTGSIMGTAQYLSPEQAQGHDVSAPSDLYSIGIILYELLTGELPFQADSAVAIALKQVSEDPVPPGQLNPEVSPELESVVLRALAKDPDHRFASADEMIAALRGAAQGLSSGAGIPPLPPPQEDRLLPTWWPWAAAGVVAVIAALVLVLLLTGGGAMKRVPRVVGIPQADAEVILKDAGFKTDIIQARSDKAQDTVTSQTPSVGELAQEGSTVRLIVSSGPGSNVIPDVTGLTRVAARKALEAAGYKVAFIGRYDEEIPRNRVVETRPVVLSTVDRGQTIKVFYSKGKEPVDVPSVTGMDIEEARTTLEDAGLEATETEQETTTEVAGTVLSQLPLGGTKAAKGSKIALTVATTPTMVAVPDVVGSSQTAAFNTLTKAGFIPRAVDGTATTPADDGKVIAQNPPSTTLLRTGRTVTVTVGRFSTPTTPTTPTPVTP